MQLHLNQVFSLGYILFLIMVKPLKDPLLNRLEIFNEACLLVSSYHLFAYVSGPSVYVGWSQIAVCVLAIVVNIVFMLTQTIGLCIRFCKYQYKRWKSKNLLLTN